MSYVIPGKVQSYIKRLCLSYKSDNARLADFLRSAKIFVREGVSYDNYNGGTYGHDIIVFFPESFFESHTFREQEALKNRLLEDLRAVASGVANEFVSAVSFDLADEADHEFQAASSGNSVAEVTSESLSFWHKDYVRLFISHRDKHKVQAHELREELEKYGISSFVAHDTIQPMLTWQGEILKALQTMEVLLCFITDDFDKSVWTNQEVGYALGRRTPIISVKLEKTDPAGFIATEQALRGNIADVRSSAIRVVELISSKVGHGERIKKSALEAFSRAKSFSDAELKFDRLVSVAPKLTEEEASFVVDSFNSNGQIKSAYYLAKSRRMQDYLARATGRTYQISHGELSAVAIPEVDEIPF